VWLHGQRIDYSLEEWTRSEEQLNKFLPGWREGRRSPRRPNQVACLVERKQFNSFGAIALAGARTGIGKTDLSKDALTITEAMLREFRVAAITRRASNGPG